MTKNLQVYALFLALIIFNTAVINAQETKKTFTINLKSGSIAPQKMTNLSHVNEDSKYLLMQFETLPQPSELKQQGISSLNYVNKNTIFESRLFSWIKKSSQNSMSVWEN